MKRFSLVYSALLCLPLVTATAATAKSANATATAALTSFLEAQGYGGSPLRRRVHNHLFADTVINGKRTALMIDTGCPHTLINRDSARRLGLRVGETQASIVGIGGTAQRCGATVLSTLAMGNCTFMSVPVSVADESQINRIARPHLDGLFGIHEMAKFGVVVDCARQMIYVNPKGSSAVAGEKLAQYLASRGFSRVPMRLNERHHLEINASVNGQSIPIVVDTGAALTLLAAPYAVRARVGFTPLYTAHSVGVGIVKQLGLGNLVINNAEVAVGNVPAFVKGGLLGEEYLSWNFAIIDFGAMNLYLRPADSR